MDLLEKELKLVEFKDNKYELTSKGKSYLEKNLKDFKLIKEEEIYITPTQSYEEYPVPLEVWTEDDLNNYNRKEEDDHEDT